MRRALLVITVAATLLAMPSADAAVGPVPTADAAAKGEKDCSDFATQRQAQGWFKRHDPGRDPAGLDADHDRIACEENPCPCAGGKMIFEGTTAEGVAVKLTLAATGNATAFTIGKTEVTCGHGTLTNRSGTYKGFDRSHPGGFSDTNTTASDNGGYHFETKSQLHGAPAPRGGWQGTFALLTEVFQSGTQVDTCRLSTRWSAT